MSVRLPQFEGPLDLLLHLIERRELEITAISLTSVADQFLAYVAELSTGAPAALADFVALAARLVLIKSRALLPRPVGLESNEGAELEDVEALARQLAEYRQARATALALAERQAHGLRAYSRPPQLLPPPPPLPLTRLSLTDLTRVLRRRLLELPAEPARLELRPALSLPATVAALEGELAASERLWLSQLLAALTSRPAIIITFIALLELIRRRRILVVQAELFGEIEIVPWSEVAGESQERADGNG